MLHSFLISLLFAFSLSAHAQTLPESKETAPAVAAPAPNFEAAPAFDPNAVAPAPLAQGQELQPEDWFVEFARVVPKLQGLQWQAQLILIITLLISALRVSKWRPFWEKLGPYQFFLAPGLAVASCLLVAVSKGEMTSGALWVGATTGAGAIALREVFDRVKEFPRVNKYVLKISEVFSALLGGKKKS